MAVQKRFKRHKNKTVFIAAEGATEVAFLNYLKSIYIARNCGVAVTVKNAYGKGPSNVIDKAVRAHGDFDKRIALFDGDIPISQDDAKLCKEQGILQVVFHPAIEAVLLEVLGKAPKRSTAECKRQLERLFVGSFLEIATYEKYMSKEMLEAARATNPELNRLIALIERGEEK